MPTGKNGNGYDAGFTDSFSGCISFEANLVDVTIDGTKLRLEPGQTVVPHGVDRDLTTDEIAPRS